MTLLKIELPPDELQRFEALARRYGYDTPDEYLRAVVEDMLNDEDESDEEILHDLKDAWREAKRGEGMSAEDLWKFVENDTPATASKLPLHHL